MSVHHVDVTHTFSPFWTSSEIDAAFPTVPDFPIPGVFFRDITPWLADSVKFDACLDEWYRRMMLSPIGRDTKTFETLPIDGIVCLEARGWILSSVRSRFANPKPAIVAARKPGKLPGDTIFEAYGYEYDSSELHVSIGTIVPGKRYVVIDDIAVSLGTAGAACRLITKCGGIVAGVSCLMSLEGLASPSALPEGCPFLALFGLPTAPANAVDAVQPALTAKICTLSEKKAAFVSSTKDSPATVEATATRLTRHLTQPCVIFADKEQEERARQIVAYAPHLFRMGRIDWGTFPDKSINAVMEDGDQLQSRHKHLVYIGTLFEPAQMARQCMVLSALSEQVSKSFTAEFPYFSTGTHERISRSGGYFDPDTDEQLMTDQAVATTKAVFKMLSSCISGSNSTLRVCDLHTPGGNFYLDSSRLQFLQENSMTPTLLKVIRQRGLDKDPHFAVAFLDAGAAKKFSKNFAEIPYITCDKVRGAGTDRKVTISDHHLITPEQAKQLKTIWFVDDLIMSGSTSYNGLVAFKNVYPDVNISMWVTHGVFPNNSHKHFVAGGKYAGFREVFVCDTIPETERKLRQTGAPFRVVRTAPMMADTLLRQFGWYTDVEQKAPLIAPQFTHVASGNADKLEAVRRALLAYFPHTTRNKMKVLGSTYPSHVPEQPIGALQTQEGCSNRLMTLEKSVWLSGGWSISLERGNLPVPGSTTKWMDQTCCVVRKQEQSVNPSRTYEATVWSRALPIDTKFVEASLASDQTITAGSLKAIALCETKGLPAGSVTSSDWYQAAHGVSCVDIMEDAVMRAIESIQMHHARTIYHAL